MEQPARRKLTTILMADVVEYGRLMGEDEAGTVRALQARRSVFTRHIQQRNGRVVDAKGDALMAEFTSVVDAVAGAVEIQREIAGENEALAENRRMRFRIGVNLGDVVEEDSSLYGDGVNIAGRLESLAEPGGVCISRGVHDQIVGKLPLEFEYLGEQQIKTETVRAYKVVVPEGAEMPAAGAQSVALAKRGAQRSWKLGLVVAAVGVVIVAAGRIAWYLLPGQPPSETAQKGALTLPDKPSIAVLPFVNMSGDPEQEYFSDGLTEDIITDLSKLRDLMVIARNSSFKYKGKAVDVRQVGRDLGVRYVLDGSVRKYEDRVRITAQLVDATTGNHLWAARFDRELKDVFAVQDEITRRIVTELDVKLLAGEDARVLRKTLTDFRAYELHLRAREQSLIFTPESNAQARALEEQAIKLDPGFASAYSGLAFTHFLDANFHWSDDRQISTQKALALANEALRLDPELPDAYSFLGMIHSMLLGDHDRGVSFAKKGVALQPNGAFASLVLGILFNISGEPESALRYFEISLRLDPFPIPAVMFNLGRANHLMGRLDEAIGYYQAAIDKIPKWVLLRLWMTAAYIEAGREPEARGEIDTILELDPEFTLEKASKFENFKRPEDLERLLTGLRKAGLK